MKSVLALSVLLVLGFCSADPALPCDETACQLPDCYCSTTDIPGGVTKASTPQIITLTFIGNVPANYYTLYTTLLNRDNPNGCPAKATFYVVHDYTDYPTVNKLAAAGHEIASNTISGGNVEPSSSWTVDQWTQESVGMREILSKFGLIDPSDVLGSRAPYFQHGGNIMVEALTENGFTYDSSIISENTINTPVWPYTMDYKYSYDCFLAPCVLVSYPGFWEYLITFLQSSSEACETLPSCTDVQNADDAFAVLKNNFDYHYSGTRAPFNIVVESSFFNPIYLSQGLEQFLDYVGTLEDTYILSVNQTIAWVQNPTPLSDIANFEPWQCNTTPNVGDCSKPYSCYYNTSQPFGGERYTNFCSPCPPNYPWTGNPDGL